MIPLSGSQALLGRSIPVLCYHQVRPDSGMTPEKFGSHLDLISRLGFETISLSRLFKVIAGHERLDFPAIVITFDDCTLDNWVYAVPELHRRGMSGVFFAITDFLQPGNPRARADQGSTPRIPAFGQIMSQALDGNCEWFMNRDEIRAIVHDLNMEVYAHSAAHQGCFTSRRKVGILGDMKHWSHKHLCGYDAPLNTPVFPVGSAYAHNGFGFDWKGNHLNIENEKKRLEFCISDFEKSKEEIINITGNNDTFLCFPWGEYDNITLKAANLSGFQGTVSLDNSKIKFKQNTPCVGRLAVKDKKSLQWLKMKCLILAHVPLVAIAARFFSRG